MVAAQKRRRKGSAQYASSERLQSAPCRVLLEVAGSARRQSQGAKGFAEVKPKNVALSRFLPFMTAPLALREGMHPGLPHSSLRSRSTSREARVVYRGKVRLLVPFSRWRLLLTLQGLNLS